MSGRQWTKDEIAEINRLSYIGCTMRQIADRMEATYDQIRYIREKLEINVTRRVVGEKPDSERLRDRWKIIIPELKANLIRDIQEIN